MRKNLIVGLVVGALLVYFSFKDIDMGSVAEGFKSVRCGYAFLALFCLFLMQVLRSYRWGLLLAPLDKIGQFDLFAVTSVGFLAVVAVPARLGELARPYLIAGKSNVSMAVALGTVFVERIFDILTILAVFFLLLLFIPLPPWLAKAGMVSLLAALAALALLLFLIFKREEAGRLLTPVFKRLPESLNRKVEALLRHFIDGLAVLSKVKTTFSVAGLSVLIWVVDAAAVYLLFLSFGFDLPFAAAFVVMVVLIIGIAIPTAPGFIGNWHFFCILGLSLFGVPKADALSYALIFHALGVGVIIFLGLAFLPFNRFSLADIRRRADINVNL
ncbi:MAG TPA: lysylphosphatidylglycerol synthase transmembrane domain-containing protein [Syntrophales bacterium]|nr:lysylphosphatidylglycerol synthase transmembrane domain-containing protein [Syntrophales bacterium]